MKIDTRTLVSFLTAIFCCQAIALSISNRSAISQTQTTPKVSPKPSLSPTAPQSTKPKWDSPRLVNTLDILTEGEKNEDNYKITSTLIGKPFPLAISPNGKTLASGGVNTIRLWDLQTGKEIVEPLFSQQGVKPLQIILITFNSDGSQLNIVSSGTETFESSNFSNNVDSNTRSDCTNSNQHNNSISSLGGIDNWFKNTPASNGCFNFNISLNTGSSSKRSFSFNEPLEQVWNISNRTLISSAPPSRAIFRSLIQSKFASLSDQDATKSIDSNLPSSARQMIESQHDGEIFSMVFTDDAKTLATSGKDGKIRIWRND